MVKEHVVKIGEVAEGQSLEVRWDLTIPASEIIHFAPDCGCTANIFVDEPNNQIVATYTEDDAKSLDAKQKRDWYPEGTIPISKAITVYLRDDKNLIVLNDQDQNIFNPEKRFERIGFTGTCRYNPVN